MPLVAALYTFCSQYMSLSRNGGPWGPTVFGPSRVESLMHTLAPTLLALGSCNVEVGLWSRSESCDGPTMRHWSHDLLLAALFTNIVGPPQSGCQYRLAVSLSSST